MSWLRSVLVLYALLNIGGGVAGYITAKSIPSIISGSVAGLLIFVAVAVASTNPKAGYILAAVVAVGDLGFFSMKLSKGAGIWPAGVMVAASVAVLACLVYGHFFSKAA